VNQQAIRRSIRNLVQTIPTERFFNPILGSDVRQSLFEFVDFGTASVIRDQILNTISNFEPRVNDVDVQVDPRPDENEFEIAINRFRKNSYNSENNLELYILSFIIDIRIVVYNNYNIIIGLYLNGEVPITEENINNFTSEQFRTKTVFIKLDFDNSNKIPKNIYSIYYL
jgi:phage baseplate assembly protein W